MNLKENIKLFEDNKIEIIQLWISSDNAINILEKHNIDKELFVKNYAFGILNYYIGVVCGEKVIGDCPVIDKLLEFLRERSVRTEDLFLLCSGFKDSLIEFTYNHNINTKQLNKDINYIFEQNFAGVLYKYSQTIKETTSRLKISDSIINNNVIMSTTDVNGIITDVSDAFCRISGFSRDELIGQSHSKVRHPDMPKETFSDLWETISSGAIWRGEVKNIKKDNGFYWVYATITPNFDEDKNIISYTSVRQDITAKKVVDEQQSIIIEQSKAAAMGELITMLAHQWRQPLQAIAILIQKLPLEKMLDDEISDETLDKVVNGTEKQLSYMSKTIDDFSDFFKPEKTKENILVSDLVEKAREIIAYMLQADNIDFTIDANDDCEINIHINEIAQVLINIIKNARDALVELRKDNRTISLKYYKKDNNMVFEIQDNAGGIPEDILDKIFEPYFSTKKNKNGTGLGLYMSKNIVENHGQGLLSVKNKDSGAMFKIVLPIN